MSNGNKNNAVIGSRSELPSPRFDAHAHLKAQPVRLIPKSRTKLLFEKIGYVFADGSRALVLIVALGLLTGALIGASLVGQNTSAPVPNAQALAVPAENEASRLQDASVGVYGIQINRANIRSGGSRRTRAASYGQTRAYRFAVIR